MIASARPAVTHEFIDEQCLTVAMLSIIADGAPADASQVAGTLPVTAFATEYADVYPAIASEVLGNQEPTLSGVLARLRAAGHEKDSEADRTFWDAANAIPAMERRAAAVARHHAGNILRRHRVRTSKAAAEGYAVGNVPASDLISAIEGAVAAVTPPRCPSLRDILGSWKAREKKPKVATGLPWFDLATAGELPVGGMIGLFAPPKSAKSALALQLVAAAMLENPELRVCWARGEMTEEDFANRFLAVAAGLLDDCGGVTLSDAENRRPVAMRAAEILERVYGDRITWVPPRLTVEAIDAELARTDSGILVVDYLQKLELPDGGKDRTSDLDKIVGQLRDITERRSVATILISSMSKPTSGTGSHLGQLGRGSVDIGHAVEIGYEAMIKRDTEGNPVKDVDHCFDVRWRCAGARNLEQRDLALRFHGATQTFFDAEPIEEFREFGNDAFATGAPR